MVSHIKRQTFADSAFDCRLAGDDDDNNDLFYLYSCIKIIHNVDDMGMEWDEHKEDWMGVGWDAALSAVN